MKLVLTDEDLRDMRAQLAGNVSDNGERVTDEQLRRLIDEMPALAADAFQFGWGDTEVRDQLCAVVELWSR